MSASAKGNRVLILVENLPVPLDQRVWQEARELRRAGYEVTIVCPKMRGYTAAEEELEGIRILRHWVAEEASSISGFFREYLSALFGEIRLTFKVWRETGFDIIHLCNPPDILFLVALPYKWLFGTKIIFDVHDLWPEMFEAKFRMRGLLYGAVRLAERCTLALANRVIATNESVRAACLKRSRKTPEEITVVRTSPTFDTSSARENPQLLQGRRFLVGYIGVMGSSDGVDLIVKAARHIVMERNRTDVQFLLMGTGPEHSSLLKLRDSYGLTEYISMPGRVSHEELASGLTTMDLGVSCDPINNYNHCCTMNKVLEYMAFGKPQVLFDLREGRVSAGEAAHYVPTTSSEALGDAILALLDDPDERARLGSIARHRLQNELGWDRSAKNLLEVYESCKKA